MSSQTQSSVTNSGGKKGSFIVFVIAFVLSVLGQTSLALIPTENSPLFVPTGMLLGAIGVSAGGILTIRGTPGPSIIRGSRDEKFWRALEVGIGAMSALIAGLCTTLLSLLWRSAKSSTPVGTDWLLIFIIALGIVVIGGCVAFGLTIFFVARFAKHTQANASTAQTGASAPGEHPGNFVVLIVYLLIGWALFRRD